MTSEVNRYEYSLGTRDDCSDMIEKRPASLMGRSLTAGHSENAQYGNRHTADITVPP